MAKPRIPRDKAAVTGADLRNPGRFAGRNEPQAAPLGEPSPFLKEPARDAWLSFVAELPCLRESDRALVEIAAELRGKLRSAGGVGINVLQTYSAVLSKLGATPVDRSRVSMPDEDDNDPDGFFEPRGRA